MTQLRFEVLHGSWTAEGREFAGGEHTIEDADPELIRLAAAAHAAGALRVDEGLDLSHVEDDEVSKEKLAEAMGEWIEPTRDPATGAVLDHGRWSGPWYEGHIASASAAALPVGVAEIGVDVEPEAS